MHFRCHDIRHQRFAHTHLWPCCSVLSLQHEIRVLQAKTGCCGNLATRLRVGPLCSTIQLSPLSSWPQQSTDKATMQVNSVPSGSWLCIWHGPLHRDREPFKHLLHATAHPQFFVLELRVHMGACPGQYGNIRFFLWQCYVNTSEHK